jgi:glycosyltransferase involved in cell wall biosynthesis
VSAHGSELIMIINAVMCVWNEEDIIESTVKHAFAQGCSNVFIVDNASTDKTVENAVRAGAKLVTIFETKDFDEDQKVAHLNATVKYINDVTSEDKIWWLFVDADEFPNFDSKFTIIDVLRQLDSSIRAIHGQIFDHLPTHQPYHVPGYHPADFQPLCTKGAGGKIPLLRYDKEHPHLWSIGGAHEFITHGESIPILRDFLQIHHFPHRNPEFTFPRTKVLAQTRNEWYKKFLHQVNAPNKLAYEERYNRLKATYDKSKNLALKTNTLVYSYKNIVRWYDIYTDKHFSSSSYDKFMCIAIYYFFMQEFDIALCRFKDAFDICDDYYIRLWLTTKIAECLSVNDVDDAQNVIFSVKKNNNIELNTYIDKYVDLSVDKKSKDNYLAHDLIRKVDFYSSVFPEDIEERYKNITTKIEKNIIDAVRDLASTSTA